MLKSEHCENFQANVIIILVDAVDVETIESNGGNE